MLEIASQMILCLLLAALLGFIIGYLFGKMTCGNDDCTHVEDTHTNSESHDAAHAQSSTTHTQSSATHAQSAATAAVTPVATDVPASTAAPAILSEPRNGIKDNLTRIKGIGVKIDDMLNMAGIYHFDQIAAWTEENMAWADSTLGFPGRAKRENWVEQAKVLAEGKETEFSKRVDGGKVSSSNKA